MYKAIKIFTSRDGKLDHPDERAYGISQEGVNEIGDAKPHLGGATHIFAKTRGGPSDRVKFFTRDNLHNFVRTEKPESGWAEYPIEHGSGYDPDKGQTGWWNVRVEGAPSDTVEGIGLPHSWHVSTFVVFEWDESEANPENPEPETPGEGPDMPDQPEIPEPEQPDPTGKILKMELHISGDKYAAHIRLYTDGTYGIDEI